MNFVQLSPPYPTPAYPIIFHIRHGDGDRRCSSVVKASALRGQGPGFDSRWNPSQTYNAVDKKGGASWFLWGILPTSLKIEWSHQMINRYTMWLNGYVQCYDDDKILQKKNGKWKQKAWDKAIIGYKKDIWRTWTPKVWWKIGRAGAPHHSEVCSWIC